MQEKRLARPLWLVLAAGMLAAGLVLGILGLVQRWGYRDQPPAPSALPEDKMIPSIDENQTAGFETATFALG